MIFLEDTWSYLVKLNKYLEEPLWLLYRSVSAAVRTRRCLSAGNSKMLNRYVYISKTDAIPILYEIYLNLFRQF